MIDGDAPRAGYYQTRLVKNGPWVGVRIWFGLPVIGGEEQDRTPRWCIEVDGETDTIEGNRDVGYRCRVAIDISRYWPWCGREPIDEGEYNYKIAYARYCKAHAPERPEASPRSPVRLDQMQPILPPTR